jgi:hypothetical protein
VATARDARETARAERDFWMLYWGPLAVVEDVGLEKKPAAIEAAMVKFGAAMKERPPSTDRRDLERLSLALAHAIRDASVRAPGRAGDRGALQETLTLRHPGEVRP